MRYPLYDNPKRVHNQLPENDECIIIGLIQLTRLACKSSRVAVMSAEKHKRQRRKRQSVNAKREKSQTPKFLTAILTLPNLN